MNANIKQPEARKLKSDIFYGLKQFKKDGQDFEVTQSIDYKSVQGRLKEQTGALRMFLDLRTHFYIKKVKLDGNDYIEGYLCVESKGMGCKWNIAVDIRVRVRVFL